MFYGLHNITETISQNILHTPVIMKVEIFYEIFLGSINKDNVSNVDGTTQNVTHIECKSLYKEILLHSP